MPSVFDISHDTLAFPWAKRTPLSGLSTLAAMTLALLLGWITGHVSAGSIAAGSAFTVGFAVFHETLASSLVSMALITLGVSSATLAGSLAAGHTWMVLLLVLVAAVNYAVLAGLSPDYGWIGQQSAVFLIIASYFPLGVRYALGRTEMVLAGGLLQIALSTAGLLVVRRRKQRKRSPFQERLRTGADEVRTKLPHIGRSDTVSYALRLASTLLLATAVYRHFHIRNGYWCPMTAVLVLKPQWSDTLSRGIARLSGTIAGALIALLLSRTVPFSTAVIFLLVIACAWGCYALQAVNYAAFSLCITLYIVFLFRFGGFSQTSAAHIRLFNTVLGGAIALLVDGVWKLFTGPTRRSSSEAASGRSSQAQLPSAG